MRNSMLRFSILLITTVIFTACPRDKLYEALKLGNKGESAQSEETVPVSQKAEAPVQEGNYAGNQLLNGTSPSLGEASFASSR